MDDPYDLDVIVRRSDPDRWLASRFIADASARADVIALYAFNDELSRIADAVHEPLMGEIRLAWWREALDEVFAQGPVRRHPVVEALARVVRGRNLARAPFDAMIEARYEDLDPAAFPDIQALDRYIDGSAGALMALAIAVLSASDGLIARPAARIWALSGLWRLQRATGNQRLPETLDDAALRAHVAEGLKAAGPALADLPVAAFPAVAYCTLAKPYASGRPLSDLEKRLRLVWAVMAGRI